MSSDALSLAIEVIDQDFQIYLFFGYSRPTDVPNWPIGAGFSNPWNTNPFLHSEYGQLINGEQVAQIAHLPLVIADSIMRNYVKAEQFLHY
jgi:hypothetical protein